MKYFHHRRWKDTFTIHLNIKSQFTGLYPIWPLCMHNDQSRARLVFLRTTMLLHGRTPCFYSVAVSPPAMQIRPGFRSPW